MSNYLRCACVMPNIEVGNVLKNTESLISDLELLSYDNVKIVVVAELSLTSNNLSHLFFDADILNNSLNSLSIIAHKTEKYDMLIFVVIPYKYKNSIYEVCAVLKNGKIISFVPLKSKQNNIFSNFDSVNIKVKYFDIITKETFNIPFSSDVIFNIENFKDTTLSIDNNISFNKKYSTTILVNPSSINESIYIENKIDELVIFSKNNNLVLINANPNLTESTANNIYYSRSYIIECGEIVAKNDNFSKNFIIADVDLDIVNAYISNESKNDANNVIDIYFDNINRMQNNNEMYRKFDPTPYIPNNINKYQLSMHIVNMLAIALNKRIISSKSKTVVLGLSGGLDSTLCLFIINRCFDISNFDKKNIILVNMPCFGSSTESISIANELAKYFGINLRVIDIKEAVLKHFKDISHDINNTNVVFENAQARERTQILMDIANDVQGIVIGTSDLSESALGFCTYNGDQMSMYNLIQSIPKTMIRFIFNSLIDEYRLKNINEPLIRIFERVLHIPISPELLPVVDGKVSQFSEKIVGDYLLVDFFLYYYLNYHFSIDKIFELTLNTFVRVDSNKYDAEYIKKCLDNFFNRFFTSQFKRNASPDSPNIGLKGLCSHTDFIAPSDLNLWKKTTL